MNISVKVFGMEPLRNSMRRVVLNAKPDSAKVVIKNAHRLLTSLREHAAGRPGPEIVTGAYRNAFQVILHNGGLTAEASNPSPQAHRLEFGFVGRDSLGRVYNQPPYPHFRPAIEETMPVFKAEMAALLPKWLR